MFKTTKSDKNTSTNYSAVVSFFFYVSVLILIQCPIFLVQQQRVNFYQVYFYVQGIPAGADDLWATCRILMNGELIILVLFQLAAVGYLLTVLLGKKWYLNVAALLLALVHMVMSSDAAGAVTENEGQIILALALMIACGLELLITKMMAAFQEAYKEAKEISERERKAKEEKKRRLAFSGNYPPQFYRMVWKNFRYNWKDYMMFLSSSALAAMLAFAGGGCYQMMAGLHREENFLVGQGLGLVLLKGMVPIGVCSCFLMVFLLIFYLRKWMESYSIFMTLGIRRKSLYTILGMEMLFCYLFSILFGMAFGNILTLVLRNGLAHELGAASSLAPVTVRSYLIMTGMLTILYIISLMAVRDIMWDFNLVHTAVRRVCKEKMPGKYLRVLAGLGVLLVCMSIWMYAQLTRHESFLLLLLCFAGVFLLIRYGGAWYLRKERGKESYLPELLCHNQLYHRSKTNAWYLTVLVILNTCGLFYFSFQMVSIRIAEEPEALFPYDFVCIADDNDTGFFDRLEQEYGVETFRFPMVRVSSADRTEKPEPRQKRAQGQQIGISETTYHQLKEMLDPEYQASALQLDPEGESIYIVHQQDRSIKAQPIDFLYGSRDPFLHIGLPCPSYMPETPSQAFTQRKVAGEEIGSLIGCFRQGNLENLVVFSDVYFEEAREMWKYTNIYTGDFIENEEERIENTTIRQGPTQLVLLCVARENLDQLEEEMHIFEERHAYEAQFDSEVSSWYAKETAVSDMKTERALKWIVNLFVFLVMLVTGMFLLYVKSISDMEEKKERSVFLKCMGMRRKDRVRILKGELYRMYWLPMSIALALDICFTTATFHARMYDPNMMLVYVRNGWWTLAAWAAAQAAFIWMLGQWYVRKVEGKDEREQK